jgi:predicted O-methyltransferase YrrM
MRLTRTLMDQKFATVRRRYQARLVEEEATYRDDPAGTFARRDEYLLGVGEDVAQLLHALIVGRKAQRILELGSSYGYSTLFLANAARASGGRVYSVELAANKQTYARQQIEEAGLSDFVEWHLGDATQLLRSLDGPWDIVLVDLWKELYVACFDLFYPKLSDNALIVADNMLYPDVARRDAEAYRAAVRSKRDLHTVLLPIGNGVELSCLWRQEPTLE